VDRLAAGSVIITRQAIRRGSLTTSRNSSPRSAPSSMAGTSAATPSPGPRRPTRSCPTPPVNEIQTRDTRPGSDPSRLRRDDRSQGQKRPPNPGTAGQWVRQPGKNDRGADQGQATRVDVEAPAVPILLVPFEAVDRRLNVSAHLFDFKSDRPQLLPVLRPQLGDRLAQVVGSLPQDLYLFSGVWDQVEPDEALVSPGRTKEPTPTALFTCTLMSRRTPRKAPMRRHCSNENVRIVRQTWRAASGEVMPVPRANADSNEAHQREEPVTLQRLPHRPHAQMFPGALVTEGEARRDRAG
jgi:hypothetical protein